MISKPKLVIKFTVFACRLGLQHLACAKVPELGVELNAKQVSKHAEDAVGPVFH